MLDARVDTLERAIERLTGQPLTPAPSMPVSAARMAPALTKRAAALFGVSVAEIMGDGRRVAISRARWAICWVMRERWGFTANSIGNALNIDHTTVLYALDRVDELRRTDANYCRATDGLRTDKADA